MIGDLPGQRSKLGYQCSSKSTHTLLSKQHGGNNNGDVGNDVDADADDDADVDADADDGADYGAKLTLAKIMIFQGTVSGRSTFERLGQPCFSFDCCCCCPKVISATFTSP